MQLLFLIWLFVSSPVGKLPNRTLSPGEVGTTDTAVFCHPGYSSAERKKETQSIKNQVYALYGLTGNHSEYVVDHVVPLEVGGKSSVKNSFPQKHPYDKSKDSLEDKLHTLVCAGKYPVKSAQQSIATNWYTLWLKVKKIK
jgi:hypothetical protein